MEGTARELTLLNNCFPQGHCFHVWNLAGADTIFWPPYCILGSTEAGLCGGQLPCWKTR